MITRKVEGGSADYTLSFYSAAKALEIEGEKLFAAGDLEKASEMYLRSACVLRIARFPYITSFPQINCEAKWGAWTMQKRVYLKGASLWEHPVHEVEVPHTHRDGRDREVLPAYVRLPNDDGNATFPTVLLFTGLDGYRPDNSGRLHEFLARNWATIVVEIPGTADCPADPADPTSPDRLWDSLFDWMEGYGRFDMRNVMCWGLSAGGYYASRIAHTHADRLVGVVAQGAGIHHFFHSDWLEKAEGHEYPFELLPALAMKHGFTNTKEYLAVAQKMFSLVETGIVEKPSTRLLLVNGTLDGLMPIEDSMLLFEYGRPKEARFFTNALHMGYPSANMSVYPWMEEIMGLKTHGSRML
ncbi:alpha/beta-hydrolase [Poronia punctata]|nr:alpha/beta-hydrolase [Poronia punctata]